MSYKLKVIRDDREYRRALTRQRELMESEPKRGSDDLRRLEVLTVLIERYEKERFEIGDPDPIEAIRVRMEDKGLKQRDLATLLGSPVIASEILNKKRNLSLSMIRLLSEHLDIPEKVFFNYLPKQVEKKREILSRTLINELLQRGWIAEDLVPTGKFSSELLSKLFPKKRFFDYVFGAANNACFRSQLRKNATLSPLAMKIWQYKVLERAAEQKAGTFERRKVSAGKLQKLSRMSAEPEGLKRVKGFLAEMGIILVILPHLKKTHIDGAAILMPGTRRPVIALTLRYDRVDHFWFSLFHELGHILKHLGAKRKFILDDLEILDCETKEEREANRFACDTLIPAEEWRDFFSEGDYSPVSVQRFARKIGINPAIVAGRVRYETNNYRILSQNVGYDLVRKAFFQEYYR